MCVVWVQEASSGHIHVDRGYAGVWGRCICIHRVNRNFNYAGHDFITNVQVYENAEWG